MTTDEIYEIAQKAKGECVTLGWFEGNIPCMEMWREELCYYENHSDTFINVFSYHKVDGKFIIKHYSISPYWIRKVNGNSVDTKRMELKNDWAFPLLDLTEDLKAEIERTWSYEHKFSSKFDEYWKEVLKEMITVRDKEVVKNNLSHIRKVTVNKIFNDLEFLSFWRCSYYKKCTKHHNDEHVKNKIQFFQFLYNLFSSKECGTVKVIL
jgi:hypothetical protein